MLHDDPKKFFQHFNIREIPDIRTIIELTQFQPRDFGRETHLKALKRTLAPDALISKFLKNRFKLTDIQGRKTVLGDSMVFHIDSRLRVIGGVPWNPKEIATILPISPTLMLLNSPFPIDTQRLDPLDGPISCSDSFFVYPTEEKFLKKRTGHIGRKAGDVISEAVKNIFGQYILPQ